MKEGGGEGEGRKPSFLLHPPPRSFTCATFLAVFDSRSSFFSRKPYRNACYAGYNKVDKVMLRRVGISLK